MSSFPQQPFYSASYSGNSILTTTSNSLNGNTWYPNVGNASHPIVLPNDVFLSPPLNDAPPGCQDIALRLDVVEKLQRWLAKEGCLNFSDAIEALFFELEQIADLLERLHQDSTPL